MGMGTFSFVFSGGLKKQEKIPFFKQGKVLLWGAFRIFKLPQPTGLGISNLEAGPSPIQKVKSLTEDK